MSRIKDILAEEQARIREIVSVRNDEINDVQDESDGKIMFALSRYRGRCAKIRQYSLGGGYIEFPVKIIEFFWPRPTDEKKYPPILAWLEVEFMGEKPCLGPARIYVDENTEIIPV